jgi:enediyne polyketide synthase
VTGGAKGIGAECAAALGSATAARLVLLGRSAEDDPAVTAVLGRLLRGGATASYHRLDITDADAVATRLAAVRAEHGPVRALLHAAGHNEPAPIAQLTPDRLAATLDPKAAGLDNVLAALDLTQLRFAVTFGSVIGRTGLAGESDYAIANDWLARRCAELSDSVPDVRWLNIEWSAWSETGMGVRLGALDGLVRQGLSPIPVAEGVALLLRLLATPDLPPTVLVAGRLPVSPTLRWGEEAEQVGSRFLEAKSSHTPGVELVADATLSLGTDPYLADHRIDTVALLPAVFGLEAMAQTAVALGAKPVPAVFRDVAFSSPVTVPERGNRVVRLAALAREDGGIDAVVRSDESQFAVDHFAGRYDLGAEDPPPARPLQVGPLIDGQPLYGPLFFHGPRFRRVRGFHGLSGYRCTASVTAEPAGRWFGAFHAPRLELGDPGARDAFLHALQVCVPDRRVLPVGAERITVYRRPAGRLTLDARQRSEDGDTFVFDLTISDAGRSVVEEWYGLRLRAVGALDLRPWPVELLGPYLARSLRRWQPGVAVDLTVAPAARTDRYRTRAVATWLTGSGVEHTADGRLVPTGPGARAGRSPGLSASHLGGYLLVAAGTGAGTGPVAVDWERVGPVPVRHPVAELLGEDGTAGTRAWTCREVIRKLGLPTDAPLVLAGTGPDGWVELASGGYRLYSAVVDCAGGPVAVCVGAG